MKHILLKITGIVSITLLICTLICGGWVATHPVEDMNFHAQLSAISVIVAIITQFLYMSKCKACKKGGKVQ